MDIKTVLQRVSLRALTHKSCSPDHYEKLEILGDSVLGLAVIEYLLDKFPDASEGDIAKMKSELVSAEYLAKVGEKLGLAQHIRIKGRVPPSVIADVVEAIIGDLHINGIPRDVHDFIHQNVIGDYSGILVDHKTALYEAAAKLGDVIRWLYSEGGVKHYPVHKAACYYVGANKGMVITQGQGRTRRIAEQEAALEMLKLLQLA